MFSGGIKRDQWHEMGLCLRSHKHQKHETNKLLNDTNTGQKMKFSIKGFLSKFDQTRSFLRIWSHLLKKSLIENFIFCAVISFCM